MLYGSFIKCLKFQKVSDSVEEDLVLFNGNTGINYSLIVLAACEMVPPGRVVTTMNCV